MLSLTPFCLPYLHAWLIQKKTAMQTLRTMMILPKWSENETVLQIVMVMVLLAMKIVTMKIHGSVKIVDESVQETLKSYLMMTSHKSLDVLLSMAS